MQFSQTGVLLVYRCVLTWILKAKRKKIAQTIIHGLVLRQYNTGMLTDTLYAAVEYDHVIDTDVYDVMQHYNLRNIIFAFLVRTHL